VAVIERAPSGFSVFFPDVPGCTNAGATVQEAATNAEQALQAHLTLALDAIPVDTAARVLVRFEVPECSVRQHIRTE
jgi:predicted RNase H-like HicB family nuclease